MRIKQADAIFGRLFAALLMALALLSIASSTSAQGDAEASEPQGDPMLLALTIAREIIEEERGKPLTLLRWRFYEDDWSLVESWQLYGSFGIDNCVAEVPIVLKRGHILFGWTFTLTDISGKDYQARVSYDLAESVVCDAVHVPPRYGGPTGAESPAEAAAAEAAPATAGPEGFALGGHVAGFDGNTAAIMKSAGMTWVKKQVRHGVSDGRDIIAQAHGQGFKVMLGALGSKQSLAENFDGYVAEFAQYVGFLASNGADAIEVWNEPNIEREWPQGQVNGGSYVKLLKAAYEAIKAANPATIVISGAPAPTGYFGAAGCSENGCNDDVFMQQMAEAGAAQYMDCLGLHYNEGVVSPTQNSGDPRDPYPTRFFNSMLFRGAQYFPNSKVCWTELGYLSAEGMGSAIPPGFDWTPNDPVTVAEQAQWLAEATRLSRDSGRVSILIVWNVNFTAWGADPQGGYAIVRPGGGCPACDPLRQAVA